MKKGLSLRNRYKTRNWEIHPCGGRGWEYLSAVDEGVSRQSQYGRGRMGRKWRQYDPERKVGGSPSAQATEKQHTALSICCFPTVFRGTGHIYFWKWIALHQRNTWLCHQLLHVKGKRIHKTLNVCYCSDQNIPLFISLCLYQGTYEAIEATCWGPYGKFYKVFKLLKM